jgi:FdhD protein
LARQRIDARDGIAMLTSRASSEMVQKAATVGIPMLAAISAPTGLAVRIAEDTGVTLVAWLRGDRFSVYAHGDRIRERVLERTQ